MAEDGVLALVEGKMLFIFKNITIGMLEQCQLNDFNYAMLQE